MRRFELVEGTSSKFWEIAVAGSTVKTQWGRIGTSGQSKEAKLATPAAATAAAEKQIGEKLRKGYVETKKAKSATSPKSVTTPTTSTKTAPARPSSAAAKGGGAFSFTKEQDGLYAMGWPHMHRVVDAKGSIAAAKAALRASDPVFAVDVPRDTAHAFLRAMVHDRTSEAEREKALKDPRPIDDAALEAIVLRLAPGAVNETYEFRAMDAAFLLEAFLGTERVAEALVARLVICATTRALWDAGQLDNMNYHAFHLADALAYMRFRLSPARWKAIIAPLAKLPPKLFLARRLALLADDKLEWSAKRHDFYTATLLTVALQRGDARAVRSLFEMDRVWPWSSPRIFYVGGVDLLGKVDMKTLVRLPPWSAKAVVAQFGTIKDAATVRVMMWLLSARPAKAEAAAWLVEHGEYARPVLERLAGDAAEGALATAALGVLGGGVPRASRKLTSDQVFASVWKMLNGLEKRLVAAKGKPDAERKVMGDAYTHYCETRAAGGDESPEFYFTHHLAEVKWKSASEAVDRWLELAVNVASG